MNFTRYFALIVSALGMAISLFAAQPEPKEADFTPEYVRQCKERADNGDAEGQVLYGYALCNGWSVEKDEKAAVEYVRKAADAGNASAQYFIGSCHIKGQGVAEDMAEGVKWYTKAAEQGHDVAQFQLSLFCALGVGCERNLQNAVKWCEKSAEQGNADAQYHLACYYDIGMGTETNYVKAVDWYTKAAKQGNARAQCALGKHYESGNGVATNLVKAVNLYRRAAEQGLAEAQYLLGNCYIYIVGEGQDSTVLEPDAEKAVEWFRKAAAQGYADAMVSLGVCYELGAGVETDGVKALEWYTKAERAKAKDVDRTKLTLKLKILAYSLIQQAKNQLHGLFGMKLCKVMDQEEPCVTNNAGELVYQFTPQKPFRGFTHYVAFATPVTRTVYGIRALQKIGYGDDADKEIDTVIQILEMKFNTKPIDLDDGKKVFKFGFEDFISVSKSDDGEYITIDACKPLLLMDKDKEIEQIKKEQMRKDIDDLGL